MSLPINLSGVVDDSIADGPGLRAAIFTQGCPHRCAGCHNPETHDFAGGTRTDADELFARIRRNPLLSGVTFSGGEPLCQAVALVPLAKKIKEAGLELAVYTGYTWEELRALRDPAAEQLLSLTDILVDGRFLQDERSLEIGFRGSRNQRIIDVPASLRAGTVVPDTSGRWQG